MGYTIERAPSWLGKYPMLDTTHQDELEMMASINEHHYGMPRAKAEEKAHTEYRRGKIIEAAAHHLNGIHAAHAIGNKEAATKHAVMYGLAMHQLGHKDLVTPPDEVATRAKNTPSEDIARFKAHPGDAFSTPPNPTSPAPRGQLEPDVKREAQKMREAQMPKVAKAEEDTDPLYQQQGYQNHPIGSTGGGLKHNQEKQDQLVEAAYHGALPIEAKFSPANKGAAKNVFTTVPAAKDPHVPKMDAHPSAGPESMVLAGALALGHGVSWLKNIRKQLGRK